MSERMLHHEKVTAEGAEPSKWLYLLHGIFGMGRNWSTVARRVVRERPEWGAVLVDLREHGGSRGFPPPHTLVAAAGDVVDLSRHLGARLDALLGHSFGGKVALAAVRDHPDLVRQLWVVDSTPEVRLGPSGPMETLDILRRNLGPFESREAVVQALEAEGVETGIARWLAMNVGPGANGFAWHLDLNALEELLEDFSKTDLWSVVESPPDALEIHFLKAEGSNMLSAAASARIEEAGRRTGRVSLHRLPGGHWLNADNPDGVVRLLVEGLV